ncbi:hypothetical protein QQF64_023120 [Cirrhinus molitorella]|uniref:Uncharacterized protein n=1 Tax=Cirrhinus molitorella TaxID=172907 RepID=A0ABR3L4B4_9TELE
MGEGEGQSWGKSKASTQTWALGAKTRGGRELTGRKKTRLLFTEEEQRVVYTLALFRCSWLRQSRSCDLWDGDRQTERGILLLMPCREKESHC